MEKMCRCCLLAVVLVVAGQVDSLTGLKTPDDVNLVKSNRVTTLEDAVEMLPRLRRRRAAALSETEKTAIVEKHNALRRLQGASNMEHMIWNPYLASMAADWADTCEYGHGQPARDANTMPFDPIGQNLYLTSSNTIDLSSAIQAWYDEISDYDYDTRACSGVCGHYTQVVWDETREVGCAYKTCDTIVGSSITAGTYLVCNYGPGGNYKRQPFKKGDPCTMCSSGKAWCYNELCRRDCTPSDNCECKVRCANCGVADQSDCSCTCTKGWTDDYCTRECKNYDTQCGANPGWPTFWCDEEHAYVLESCPLHCGLCETADPGATCDPTTTTTTTTTTAPTTTTTTTPTTTTTTTPTTTTTTPPTTTTTTPPTTTTTTPPTTTTTTPPTTTTTTPPTTTTTTPPTTTTTTPPTTITTTPPTTTTTTPPTTTTTTPPTTTTTPPTTTTTTPSTTTTVPASDPCAVVTCQNGGTAYVQQDECKCRCTADWQGTNCEESRAQARIGVVLRIRAPVAAWDILWRFIQPIIVRSINRYCNSHVSTCCPGASITNSGSNYEYLTSAQLQVGAGYPRGYVVYGQPYTLALIYATGAPDNALCASVGAARRRRAIDTGSSLPQEVLLSAVKSVQSNLTAEMSDCCNATLDSVSPAVVVVVVAKQPDDATGGFPKWAISVMIVAGVAAVIIFAAVALAVAFRPKRKTAPMKVNPVKKARYH